MFWFWKMYKLSAAPTHVMRSWFKFSFILCALKKMSAKLIRTYAWVTGLRWGLNCNRGTPEIKEIWVYICLCLMDWSFSFSFSFYFCSLKPCLFLINTIIKADVNNWPTRGSYVHFTCRKVWLSRSWYGFIISKISICWITKNSAFF